MWSALSLGKGGFLVNLAIKEVMIKVIVLGSAAAVLAGLGVVAEVTFDPLEQTQSASAHTGDLEEDDPECTNDTDDPTDGDDLVARDWTLTVGNVPPGVYITKVESHSGTDDSFPGTWSHSTWPDDQWVTRAVNQPVGTTHVTWTTFLPGTWTGKLPWEFSITTFSNGVKVYSDGRSEGKLTGDCYSPNPPSGTVTFKNTYCDALAPVGNSGNLTLNDDGTTAEAFLWNGTTWVSIGNLPAGDFGDALIDDFGYPAKIKVVLTGEDGTMLPDSEHTYPSAPKNAADCLTVIETPEEPPVVTPGCTEYVGDPRPAPGPNGVYDRPYDGPGDYTQTYTAPSGTTYAGGHTIVQFPVMVPPKLSSPSEDCPMTVTLIDPSVVQSVCLATDKPSAPTYTLASIIGVVYVKVVNGVETPISAGVAHTAIAGEVAVIKAKPLSSSYDLLNPDWSWPVNLPVALCDDELAFSGDVTTRILAVILAILMVIGVPLANARRYGRRFGMIGHRGIAS